MLSATAENRLVQQLFLNNRIAEITTKVDQCNQKWHYSICHKSPQLISD